MKILVVDADPIGRAWLRQVLGPCAREIVVARHAREALSLLRSGVRPDVCVCDVSLPDTYGLQLLSDLRADETLDDLPVVLVSAAADLDAVREVAASRGCTYMLKPLLSFQARGVLTAAVLACRRARSEHFLVTMHRLEADFEQLEDRLQGLAAALRAPVDALDREDFAALRAEAATLGLHRCAQLLGVALRDDGPLTKVLGECAALADDQYCALTLATEPAARAH